MQVYILTVYDEANFHNVVHRSCWDTIAGARIKRDQVVEINEKEDRDAGFGWPSYRGEIVEMTVERSPLLAVL